MLQASQAVNLSLTMVLYIVHSEHVHTVTSLSIDSDARHDFGSDHALLLATFKYGSQPSCDWKFQEALKFHIPDNTKYDDYQFCLDRISSVVPLHQFETLTSEE